MKSSQSGRPTLEMVAKEAGVSRATVSRVVNGLPTVNPKMTVIVNAAIERLSYVPNYSARSLARHSANAVSLVVPESTTKFFSDPYFVSVVDGIAARLEDSDYMLNLLVTASDPRAKVERFLRSGMVDGSIVLAHSSGDSTLADMDATAPTVFGGRPLGTDAPHYFVDTDNLGGAVRAAQHLVDRGRRSLATITGPLSMAVGRDRMNGFLQGLADLSQPEPVVLSTDFTPEGAARTARILLEEHPSVNGIFVASDRMAVEVLRVIDEMGKRVPEDISVVGFGDSEAAVRGHRLELTTIRQPSFEMGVRLADTLLRLIAGEPEIPRQQILPTELVVRSTS